MAEQTAGVKAFIDLIEVIADNKYVLGDRLVEVGVSGPDLEATLSSIAMAQGELGHARLLYNWTFDLKGHVGKKPEIEKQTGKAFNGVVQISDWISMIAAFYTVNLALDLVLRSVFEARHNEVVTRIHKLIKEQKEHILYSRGWARQLMQDRGVVPRKFNQALNKIVPEVETWLHKVENTAALINEGYISENANLVNLFKHQVRELTTPGAAANAG
jgi:ring-1,2-phenylacetyl-CoA epoxidase subunit PaaC